jgi:hypothetical protein
MSFSNKCMACQGTGKCCFNKDHTEECLCKGSGLCQNCGGTGTYESKQKRNHPWARYRFGNVKKKNQVITPYWEGN